MTLRGGVSRRRSVWRSSPRTAVVCLFVVDCWLVVVGGCWWLLVVG